MAGYTDFPKYGRECELVKPWRGYWKVIGYARKSRQVKIKRKSFEMSMVSVFCQVEKKQVTAEY